MKELTLEKLLAITESVTGSFFLEGTKGNELGYSRLHYERFKEISSFINGNTSPQKILDVGTTPYTIYLGRNSYHHIHSIDFTDGFKERCNSEKIVFKRHDLTAEELPFGENAFDIIIFTEVFEHLLIDPVKTLSKFYKMLKPNGKFILGTPNLASLLCRIRLLLNRPILEYPTWQLKEGALHGHGHNRLYVSKELKDYCCKAGFKNIRVKYSSRGEFMALANYGHKSSLFVKIITKLIKPFFSIIPSFGRTIYIFASK